MTFNIKYLCDIIHVKHKVVRVVIAALSGSSPREVGAAMLVWSDGQSGTIGGGALEHTASQTARAMLDVDKSRLTHHALGPDLGQCCGGRVSLFFEPIDVEYLSSLCGDIIARPVHGDNLDLPLSVSRVLSLARNQGIAPQPGLLDGWMIEPVTKPKRSIWIWGAGHVGRALIETLAPLPDLSLTWIDTSAQRFPARIAPEISVIPQKNPIDLVRHAPGDAEHLIVTYSHALDLELCHKILRHRFAFAGLIGSSTKWARFRNHLRDLGHSADQIARITCPIGDPALGKHPAQIAIGVAQDILARSPHSVAKKDKHA